MDDAELTADELAEIERVQALLADPAMWAEPPADLQERVVAAIAEAGGGRRRWLQYAVGGVAAAVLVAAGVAVGAQLNQHDDTLQFAASLKGTALAPGASGDATLAKTPSGWKIELHATGLPRRANGEFYEAWLKDAAGSLVPIGTFNDGRKVVLWAGVGPQDFPLLTVTREVADGNQASSGEVVLLGTSRQ
ncbi:hypothetical protein ACVW00_001239 [Marmoricola sp. URHA0025 HA25]